MNRETDAASVALFERICEEILISGHSADRGIGTLGERTLHAVLKRFYERDEDFTERRVGRFVADIERQNEIVEIQTRDFRRLREKLPAFLANHRVKVVYPIARVKYVRWLDPATGELSARRKSPKRGSIYDFLLELYAIRPILPELRELAPDGLSFDLVYLELEEFKLLNGRSRDRKHFGATRAERIPRTLYEIVTLEAPEDYLEAIPSDLPDEFTVAEFAKAAHLTNGAASRIVATLETLALLERAGKRGRAYLYRRRVSSDAPSDSDAIPSDLPDEFTVAEFARASRLTNGAASRIVATLETLALLERAGKRGRAYIYKRKESQK